MVYGKKPKALFKAQKKRRPASWKIEHSLSRFAEAIAVMLITSCVIPVLVLLVFFWLIKVFLDLDMSGSLVKIRS